MDMVELIYSYCSEFFMDIGFIRLNIERHIILTFQNFVPVDIGQPFAAFDHFETINPLIYILFNQTLHQGFIMITVVLIEEQGLVIVIRRHSQNHFVKECTQGVKIDGVIVSIALFDFRSHILNTSAVGSSQIFLCEIYFA